MKKRFYYLVCGLLGILTMFLVFFPFPTVAQTPIMEINIVSGNEAGGYYSLAKDIEKLAKEKNLDIDVIPSKGSLQNIHDVFYYQSVPLGITQGDVLAFLNTFANDDEEARLQSESLKVVLPLYQEEVHLIASPEIQSVAELTGKTVAIGDEGSGTSTTSATLLYQWGISPKELRTYDVKRAIDALRKGQIDAMFYVVGMPAKVLEEQIFPEDNFHLLPISLATTPEDSFYTKLYSKVTVAPNTYSWQKEEVETLAVQSFLITVDHGDCEQVTPVANLVKDNLSWFKQNGDPLWKQVDLQFFHDQKPQRISKCVES